MRFVLPFVLGVAIVGVAGVAWGEDAPGKPRWCVVAECQMVVLPQKAALPLIPDLGDESKIEAAWVKVQSMIASSEATLVGSLFVQGEAGKKLIAESSEEVRFATEFDPPHLPNEIPKENAAEFLKKWPVVGITPTAFETRNIGVTLDLTASVSNDGKWIAMAVQPTHIRLLRFSKHDAGLLPSGEQLSVEQPHFSSLQNRLTIQTHSGQWVLIGAHKLPAVENLMELFLLRVVAHSAGDSR